MYRLNDLVNEAHYRATFAIRFTSKLSKDGKPGWQKNWYRDFSKLYKIQ